MPSGEKVNLGNSQFNPLLKKWTQVEMKDPNSKTTHIYEGFYLRDFLSFVVNEFKVKEAHHIVTEAQDGYKLTLSREALKSEGAFIAFNVLGVPERGLYSQYLKRPFKWRPAYIIAGGKGTGVKSVSPYQIKKLIWHEEAVANPVLTKVATPFQKGAEVFISTCSKCHQHKGYGGKKAPPMKLVLGKWKSKSDKDLKSFLRAPQETVKRKIQMSAFQGTDLELDELVKFLRSITR